MDWSRVKEMHMRAIHHTPLLFFATLAAALCALEWWIVSSAWFALNPNLLALAITADLTLGIPLLFYICMVRTRRSPAIALAPVFLVAVVIANMILPAAQQTYLDRIEILVLFTEAALLLFVVTKLYRVIHAYRRVRPQVIYASDALEISLRDGIGTHPVIKILVTELSLPYYLLFGWWRSFTSSDPRNLVFSYHRKTGYSALLALFFGLIAIETVVLHILIQHWSPLVAWILTGLSIYSLVWLVGDYQAARLNPIVLSPDHLYIRTGLRWRVDVPLSNIRALRKATHADTQAPDYLNAAVYGVAHYTLLLKEPMIVQGLLGIQKQVSNIGLIVDDEQRFLAELGRHCEG